MIIAISFIADFIGDEYVLRIRMDELKDPLLDQVKKIGFNLDNVAIVPIHAELGHNLVPFD